MITIYLILHLNVELPTRLGHQRILPNRSTRWRTNPYRHGPGNVQHLCNEQRGCQGTVLIGLGLSNFENQRYFIIIIMNGCIPITYAD